MLSRVMAGPRSLGIGAGWASAGRANSQPRPSATLTRRGPPRIRHLTSRSPLAPSLTIGAPALPTGAIQSLLPILSRPGYKGRSFPATEGPHALATNTLARADRHAPPRR